MTIDSRAISLSGGCGGGGGGGGASPEARWSARCCVPYVDVDVVTVDAETDEVIASVVRPLLPAGMTRSVPV